MIVILNDNSLSLLLNNMMQFFCGVFVSLFAFYEIFCWFIQKIRIVFLFFYSTTIYDLCLFMFLLFLLFFVLYVRDIKNSLYFALGIPKNWQILYMKYETEQKKNHNLTSDFFFLSAHAYFYLNSMFIIIFMIIL